MLAIRDSNWPIEQFGLPTGGESRSGVFSSFRQEPGDLLLFYEDGLDCAVQETTAPSGGVESVAEAIVAKARLADGETQRLLVVDPDAIIGGIPG
ncbi:MAG: hypothetical protein E6J78_05330 [Deltaproteobacteria bacterium]|nr:MAG: hypothetical protein E6J78_05330 [Deltaproteobacteria bacterium]